MKTIIKIAVFIALFFLCSSRCIIAQNVDGFFTDTHWEETNRDSWTSNEVNGYITISNFDNNAPLEGGVIIFGIAGMGYLALKKRKEDYNV